MAYVVGADQRALARLEPTEVLVVIEEIPVGATVAVGQNVELQRIPRSAVVPEALTEPAPLSGLVAAAPLYPGEQLLADRFVPPKDLTGDQVLIPEEFVQVSVVLPPERVVGGQLKAGDTVGVVLSLEAPAPNTQTILHRALVARTQAGQPSKEDSENAPPADSQFVTLAVSAVDAQRIVWGAEFGTLWLTLERETSAVDGTTQVTQENVAS